MFVRLSLICRSIVEKFVALVVLMIFCLLYVFVWPQVPKLPDDPLNQD